MQIMKKASIKLFEHTLPQFLCHIGLRIQCNLTQKVRVIGFFLVI